MVVLYECSESYQSSSDKMRAPSEVKSDQLVFVEICAQIGLGLIGVN